LLVFIVCIVIISLVIVAYPSIPFSLVNYSIPLLIASIYLMISSIHLLMTSAYYLLLSHETAFACFFIVSGAVGMPVKHQQES